MKLKRNIALVIGNSHYEEEYYKDLANPLNEQTQWPVFSQS